MALLHDPAMDERDLFSACDEVLERNGGVALATKLMLDVRRGVCVCDSTKMPAVRKHVGKQTLRSPVSLS